MERSRHLRDVKGWSHLGSGSPGTGMGRVVTRNHCEMLTTTRIPNDREHLKMNCAGLEGMSGWGGEAGG